MFETAMFSQHKKHQFVMLSLVLSLLCAGHPLCMTEMSLFELPPK